MLTLELATGDSVERMIFGTPLPKGEKVALMSDDIPIGAGVFRLENNSIIIDRIGILEEYRGKKFGDFFMRALIFKLSLAHIDIIINGVVEYFRKFGFKQDGSIMIARNGEVVFPSSCGGHNKELTI